MTATMTIDGIAYREATETNWCDGCAFRSGDKLCVRAAGLSAEAFGGVCGSRKVIYIRAEPSAPAELVCPECGKAAVVMDDGDLGGFCSVTIETDCDCKSAPFVTCQAKDRATAERMTRAAWLSMTQEGA